MVSVVGRDTSGGNKVVIGGKIAVSSGNAFKLAVISGNIGELAVVSGNIGELAVVSGNMSISMEILGKFAVEVDKTVVAGGRIGGNSLIRGIG